MAEREGKSLTTDCEAGLKVRMDTQDVEEVIGNLLDNALKWCRTTTHFTAKRVEGGIEFCIEDDGPGIRKMHVKGCFVPGAAGHFCQRHRIGFGNNSRLVERLWLQVETGEVRKLRPDWPAMYLFHR